MDKLENYNLYSSIDKNIELMKTIFKNDDTIKFRTFENQNNPKIQCSIIFIDGMVDNRIINENIIKPIVTNSMDSLNEININFFKDQTII